jgi:hypothetical protein
MPDTNALTVRPVICSTAPTKSSWYWYWKYVRWSRKRSWAPAAAILLRVSEEFMQLGDRANMVLWNLRIVGARVGEGSWGKIKEFEKAAEQLGL